MSCGWRGWDTFDREATFTGKCLWEVQAIRCGDKNTKKDEQKSWNSWNPGVQYGWWLYRTAAGSSHGQYWTTTACMTIFSASNSGSVISQSILYTWPWKLARTHYYQRKDWFICIYKMNNLGCVVYKFRTFGIKFVFIL